MAVVGVTFFATASNGTKQVDLGASILGGLVVGLAVILAERHFTRTVEVQRDEQRSLASVAGAGPVRDEPSLEFRREQPSPEPLERRPSGEQPHAEPSGEGRAAKETAPRESRVVPGHYTVEYDSRMRSPNRVDAVQARLRMFRDGEYVQFVTAVAPGSSYRFLAENVPPEDFWFSFARLAGQLAERALRVGIIPLNDPTMAFEVEPPVETAIRLARVERRPIQEGDIVHEFDIGGLADDLWRALRDGWSVRAGFKNGDESGLWGVHDVDEAGGYVTFLVPVTMGTVNQRKVPLDQIAWVEVTDIRW